MKYKAIVNFHNCCNVCVSGNGKIYNKILHKIFVNKDRIMKSFRVRKGM
jgi:hypothetical protein